MSLYSRTYLSGKKGELSDHLSVAFGIPDDRILLSYGSEDMLKQTVHCYLRNGETIMLPKESWWYYKKVVTEISGKPVEYPIREQDDRFTYDIAEMMKLYDVFRPALILIASPNNPTGNIIELSDLEQLIQHCSSSVIILDEAYHGFADDTVNSVRDLIDKHDRLIVLRTFSKYFALAGLRIGFSCVGRDLGKLVRYSARYLGYNQLTEKIALAALASGEYYQGIAARIREDNSAFHELFAGFSGFKPYRTSANFVLVRYPGAVRKELQAGLLSRGVVVKFLDDPGLEDCIRITTGTTEQNSIVRHAFREVVGELAGRLTDGHPPE